MLRVFGQCTIVGLGLGARYIIGFKRLKGVTWHLTIFFEPNAPAFKGDLSLVPVSFKELSENRKQKILYDLSWFETDQYTILLF